MTDREQLIREWLSTQPEGATATEIGRVLGLRPDTARKHLRGMDGVVCLQAALNTRWCLLSQVEAVKALHKRLNEAYEQRRRAHLYQRRQDLPEDDTDPMPIRQISIPAEWAGPCPKLGPASVWELAL